MANSLRAKLSKLRHDGHITDAEYQAFIKKMEGHDREIRAKAIDEYRERLKNDYQAYDIDFCLQDNEHFSYVYSCGVLESYVDEIAEQMKGVGWND